MNKEKIISDITKEVLLQTKTKDLAIEKKNINDMISKIKYLLKQKKINAKVILGGSAAKGTFIGNDFDIDVFIAFNYNEFKEKDISKILIETLKTLKPNVVHGSRDYLQINKRFEIIPVLEVKDPKNAINITDASPLHVKWVEKIIKSSKNKNIKEDIKLTKLFFKSAGVYGAESYIKGFSGHVTDILTIYYGSFIKTIESISKWKNKTEIDLEKHKTFLDISKTQGPLTLVDPIQKDRNAAAALGEECYNKIIIISKKFLKNPSIDFFKIKNFDLNKTKKEYNIVIKIIPNDGKTDIIGAKIIKVLEYIKKKLKLFEITKYGWFWDKNNECYIYFKTNKKTIEPEFIQEGPSKEMKEHVIKFKQKYKKAHLKDNKWLAKVKRKITQINKVIDSTKDDEYITTKIKGFKIVK
jgi:tRNA nucleotidyltransferase (CCA-adding enzyme)